jgi:bifunctional oligoribonuclease and PAP phosphatase NrnA
MDSRKADRNAATEKADRDRANALLSGAQQIIILTHIAPDGDAIGTLLGLGHALRNQGKTATMSVDEGVPPGLRFLPGTADIRANLDGVQADLVIAVDCGDESRMGNAGKSARTLGKPLINIDHHHTNTRFGDANLVDSVAVAAAECVLDWLDDLHIALTPDVAQCLLCGIVTDTLCFRTSNVTAATLGKAQRLMQAGGDLSVIVLNTVSRMPTDVIRLWGQVLPTVRIEDHVIWAKDSLAARRAANGAGGGDTKDGGLVSVLLQADQAYVSCVLHEKDNGTVELSFRAVPGFDVSGLASSLGGGGHMQASGATVTGSLDEVEARVVPLLKEAAKAGTPAVA